MSVLHGNDNQSLGLNVAENASDVDTPSSGRTTLFPKSGGWYIIDDAGLVTKVAEEATAPTFTDITISDADTPTLTITDTTTPVTGTLSAGDSNVTLQTTTSHALILGTNSTAAITIGGAGNVTVAKNLTLSAGTYTQSLTYTGTAGLVNALSVTTTVTPSGTSTLAIRSEYALTQSSGSADMTGAQLYGKTLAVVHNNTTALGVEYGFEVSAQQGSSGGGLTAAHAGFLRIINSSASNAITTGVGLTIASANNTGGGITTNIGLDVQDQTAGTTNYAIRTGAGQVSLGDDVHIDSILTMLADQTSDTAPTADTSRKKLTVQYLASPPSSAAYWAATNSPGGSVFYLVLEEG